MARTFAMTRVAIWGDDDFLDLSPMAQWLYWHLMSHPDLSYCGVTDWRPGRIVPKASGLTLDVVESAADELIQSKHVLIDQGTEEVLVRSFVRNDGLLKQTNMGVAVSKAYATVASRDLRGVIVHELNRLHAEEPEWKSWAALSDVLRRASIDPFTGESSEPSQILPPKGSQKGSANPSRNPQRKG